VNDVCALGSCDNAPNGNLCALADGGLGYCHDRQCSDDDLQNDPNNCGSFSVRCPTGATCTNGYCHQVDCADGGGCPTGFACIENYGCVTTDCELANDDDVCANPADPSAHFCCGGKCQGDSAANCGGCDVTCPAATVCLEEGCTPASTCPTSGAIGQTYPGIICSLPSGDAGECCGGSCVDTTQAANCGSCYIACPNGSTCIVNTPFEGSNQCDLTCGPDAGCPAGFSCFGGICYLSGCGPGTEGSYCVTAGSSGICCGGACVDDLFTDSSDCGGCGISCAPGENCWYGSCVQLAQTPAQNGVTCRMNDGGLGLSCSGQCVDIGSDTVNCGGCSKGCPIGDTCGCPYPDSCAYGFCLDDGGFGGGCTDDSQCPPGTLCSGTYCSPPTCDTGNTLCSGDGGNLCCGTTCVDTGSDPANCGNCGITCPAAQGATCNNGQCTLGDGGIFACTLGACPTGFGCINWGCIAPSCEFGQLYCAFAPGFGQNAQYGIYGLCCGAACVDTGKDPLNCGDCGVECPSGVCTNATCIPAPIVQDCAQSCGPGTICAEGSCVDSRCDAAIYCLAEDGAVGLCCAGVGTVDPFLSACADLASDPANCGACGVVCPPGAACINGLCNGLSACGPGHERSYCNADAGPSFLCCPGLGCIDTSADPQNCGACNVACGVGEICDTGQCGAG
jgi:hypothetical protein